MGIKITPLQSRPEKHCSCKKKKQKTKKKTNNESEVFLSSYDRSYSADSGSWRRSWICLFEADALSDTGGLSFLFVVS